MLTLNVNWLAIVLATLASMALGMGWYMVLSRQWIIATGKKQEDLMGEGGSAVPFAFAAVSQFIMAYFIAVLTPAIMGEITNFNNAVTVGLYMWFGFIITAMVRSEEHTSELQSH